MNTTKQHRPARRPSEPVALRLSQIKSGRVLLHVWATVRRPRNALWHGRCILREFLPARPKSPES